eukprot:TRINITY_DN690_c3_g1_i1.p1 TRINITY_DN690_c3_g1~~TRINITY_DN690_c3_g1_i1.p1  ORF type:complete len:1206 (+),score=409.46 TRINITY_DN690_c3_g1_i1:120-3737(+)
MSRSEEFMQTFWDLAEESPDKRLAAANFLVTHLQKTSRSFEKEDDMPSDLKYGIKRLVRGMTSSRGFAREGFSLALSQVLKVMTDVSIEYCLKVLLAETEIKETMRANEERELLFGRLFCCAAFEMSGRLNEDESAMSKTINMLKEISKKRFFLQEPAYKTIVDIMESASEEVLRNVVVPCMEEEMKKPLSEALPNELSFVLALRRTFAIKRITDIELPVLSTEVEDWEQCIKKTHRTFPRTHFLWEQVDKTIFALAGTNEKLLDCVWEIVSEKMIGSSPEQSAVGLDTFTRWLEVIDQDFISKILTVRIIRCIEKGVSDSEQVLHQPCMRALKALEVCSDKRPESRLAILNAVMEACGRKFDSQTKTTFVNDLINKLNETSVVQFIFSLKEKFMCMTGDDEANIIQKRLQVIDDMTNLVKIPSIVNHAGVMAHVLQFLIVVSFFNLEKPFEFDDSELDFSLKMKSEIRSISAPSTPIAEKTRTTLKERILSILSHSLTMKHPKGEAPVVTGAAPSGRLWAYHVQNWFSEVAADNTPLMWDEEAADLFERCNTMISGLKKQHESLPEEDETNKVDIVAGTVNISQTRSQLHAFEMLLLHLSVHQLMDFERHGPTLGEIMDILSDLSPATDGISEELEKEEEMKKVRRMSIAESAEDSDEETSASENDGQETEESDVEFDSIDAPVTVLVDILVTLLSEASSLLRETVRQVFKVVLPFMDDYSSKNLLEVITRADRMFGEEDDDEEEEEEDMDLDDEEDDEEDSEDNDDDNEKEEEDMGILDDFGNKVSNADAMKGMAHFEAIARMLMKMKKTKNTRLQVVTVEFKNRVVELLEILARDCTTQLRFSFLMNVLETLFEYKPPKNEHGIYKRLIHIARMAVGTKHWNAALTSFRNGPLKEETFKLQSYVTRLFELASKARNPEVLTLCTNSIVLILNLLGKAEVEGEPLGLLRINKLRVVLSSQIQFCKSKHSKISFKVINDIMGRIGAVSWVFAEPLLTLVSPAKKVENDEEMAIATPSAQELFNRLEGVRLLRILFQRTNVISKYGVHEFSRLENRFTDCLCDLLSEAKMWAAPKCKDMIQLTLSVSRSMSIKDENREKRNLVKINKAAKELHNIATQKSLKDTTGLIMKISQDNSTFNKGKQQNKTQKKTQNKKNNQQKQNKKNNQQKQNKNNQQKQNKNKKVNKKRKNTKSAAEPQNKKNKSK